MWHSFESEANIAVIFAGGTSRYQVLVPG
jgi:hypothetical protein